MGREVTGVRVELKSPCAKVKPKISAVNDQMVNPKSPEGDKVVKDCEVKECTSEVPRAENSREGQDVLATKSPNFESERPVVKSTKAEGQKASSPVNPTTESAAVGNARIRNTPQRSSDVTVDKEVCENPIAIETPVSPTASKSKSPSSAMKSQPSTPIVARKSFIDEDNWSMASSAASARTTRSRITSGVAPTFASEDRIEKRKEYYAKLEEKRKALEAEKQEYEARTKEEEEAAIKQLRKSLVYKANPVPSFYYEKPPAKKEVKKLPTTRAVSPKFGRRKSCSDAFRSTPVEKVNARIVRHSLSSLKERSTPTSTLKKKVPSVSSSASKMRDPMRLIKETVKKSPPKMTKQRNADIAVQS